MTQTTDDFDEQATRICILIDRGYHLLSKSDRQTLTEIGARLIAKLAREQQGNLTAYQAIFERGQQ